MHAIVYVEDMFPSNAYEVDDEIFYYTEWFQNYDLYVGDSSDYKLNTKCVGGPF